MKRIQISLLLVFVITTATAQSWVSNFPKIYVNPDTTRVGIGTTNPTERLHVNNGVLRVGNSSTGSDRAKNMIKIGDGDYIRIGEWETNNTLSFKATKYNFTNGNVGIGVTSPLYKLDVNGKLYLRTVDQGAGWNTSYIHWPYHSLVLGTPPGVYSHNSVDLKPGGCNTEIDTLFSRLRMYSATSTTNFIEQIEFMTRGDCWFMNKGNVGIGTSTPQYKLDVNGTVRANEIIVNTPSGADFVFDDDYNLRSLSDVKLYIEENRHLPDVPSAKDMQKDGMNLEQMVVVLLQKIEELTLYNILLEEKILKLENFKNTSL